MSGTVFSNFYWPDWMSDPGLRMTSLAGRGLWMDMLCLMAQSTPRGYLTKGGRDVSPAELAKIAGVTREEVEILLAELEGNQVFSRDRHGRIYSRRIVRDEKKTKQLRKFGKAGGNPELRRGTVPKASRVRPYRRTDNPAKTQRIFDRDGGKCHWCRVTLTTDKPGPTFFHVDHVVAICDGGTNDEGNLVAACASCNHARARKDWVNSPDTKSDRSPTVTPTLNPNGARPESSKPVTNIPVASSSTARDWKELEAVLRKAAGWEREPAPGLSVVGPIVQLLDAGADLDKDVLPTIRERAPKVRKRIGWSYFVNAIAEATQQRQAITAKIGSKPADDRPQWETWTEDRYENAVMVAKRKGIWPETYGPADKIPKRLVDAELTAIIARSP